MPTKRIAILSGTDGLLLAWTIIENNIRLTIPRLDVLVHHHLTTAMAPKEVETVDDREVFLLDVVLVVLRCENATTVIFEEGCDLHNVAWAGLGHLLRREGSHRLLNSAQVELGHR